MDVQFTASIAVISPDLSVSRRDLASAVVHGDRREVTGELKALQGEVRYPGQVGSHKLDAGTVGRRLETEHRAYEQQHRGRRPGLGRARGRVGHRHGYVVSGQAREQLGRATLEVAGGV